MRNVPWEILEIFLINSGGSFKLLGVTKRRLKLLLLPNPWANTDSEQRWDTA